jgi:7,8-dihydroneopterin aldolase/epimerase/oxygenase
MSRLTALVPFARRFAPLSYGSKLRNAPRKLRCDHGDMAMTDDMTLAFAHPLDRAVATSDGAPCDRISLRDHVVEVDIGAFQQERGHRQRVKFNVVVEVRPSPAPLDDDVDRILSYDRITFAIAAELAAERLNLLETLAERVAERILTEPQALRVFLRIEKLDVGPYALGVEIVRDRATARHPRPDDARHPVVVHLDNAMIMAVDLGARLDALTAEGAPLILTLGPADLATPKTGHGPTQRRIDLLAIEQNAWVLAARDPRCVVVASRTEIDWAIRRGQTVVWAPSKLVLDTPNGPRGQDPLVLSMWLANMMGAAELRVTGQGPLPASETLRVRRL